MQKYIIKMHNGIRLKMENPLFNQRIFIELSETVGESGCA